MADFPALTLEETTTMSGLILLTSTSDSETFVPSTDTLMSLALKNKDSDPIIADETVARVGSSRSRVPPQPDSKFLQYRWKPNGYKEPRNVPIR